MIKEQYKNCIAKTHGFYLPVILMVTTVFLALITALISLSLSNLKLAELNNKKISAMSIAEAGINYYLWHLAHDDSDYCDGNTCSGVAPYGPYNHTYYNQAGVSIGTYDLYITPPSVDRQVVIVKSTGKVSGRSPSKTIVAELAIPSFTKYTLLSSNEQLWVGDGEKINGSVHVNNSGLYNEGEIVGDASSTEKTYASWNWGTQPGVSGPGLFDASKMFPVPAVNMNQVSVDIVEMKTMAGLSGHYITTSNSKGYHIVLKSNNYDLYKVSKFDANNLTITTQTSVGNYLYPANGLIFVSDNLWVDGTVNDAKITIVAADPTASQNQMKRIIIPNKIMYTNYDGRDKIGLVTQTDILLAKDVPTDMEIDAAMIAKSGQIRINDFGQIKNRIRVYGSMAHNGGLLWTYASGSTILSGYRYTVTDMDPYNILNPPPEFPKTGTYSVLSWREEN
jgi:type II secretory pathway pseudopilin PulG